MRLSVMKPTLMHAKCLLNGMTQGNASSANTIPSAPRLSSFLRCRAVFCPGGGRKPCLGITRVFGSGTELHFGAE